MTDFDDTSDRWQQAQGALDLGHRLCGRYGNSPGVLRLPGAPAIAARSGRFVEEHLPLLSGLQRRWSNSALLPRGWTDLIYARPLFPGLRGMSNRTASRPAYRPPLISPHAVALEAETLDVTGEQASEPQAAPPAAATDLRPPAAPVRTKAAADSPPPGDSRSAAPVGTATRAAGPAVFQRRMRRPGAAPPAHSPLASPASLQREADDPRVAAAGPAAGQENADAQDVAPTPIASSVPTGHPDPDAAGRGAQAVPPLPEAIRAGASEAGAIPVREMDGHPEEPERAREHSGAGGDGSERAVRSLAHPQPNRPSGPAGIIPLQPRLPEESGSETPARMATPSSPIAQAPGGSDFALRPAVAPEGAAQAPPRNAAIGAGTADSSETRDAADRPRATARDDP
jgi:hypothetical protein